MTLGKAAEMAAPFGALIPASSVVIAVLYVAGFAYRWAYYYNFGLQHIVYQFSFPAILMTAIELIRYPYLHLILLYLVLPFVALNILIGLVARAGRRPVTAWPSRAMASVVGWLGLDSSIVVGALRAIVLIWSAYSLGTHLGYVTFTHHLVNSPDNPLPAVTVLLDGKEADGAAALACGTPPVAGPLIGDAKKLREIQETYQTCTGRGTTWRLLYRDRDMIVVFASQPANVIGGSRPLTLVLPATSSIRLVTQ